MHWALSFTFYLAYFTQNCFSVYLLKDNIRPRVARVAIINPARGSWKVQRHLLVKPEVVHCHFLVLMEQVSVLTCVKLYLTFFFLFPIDFENSANRNGAEVHIFYIFPLIWNVLLWLFFYVVNFFLCFIREDQSLLFKGT